MRESLYCRTVWAGGRTSDAKPVFPFCAAVAADSQTEEERAVGSCQSPGRKRARGFAGCNSGVRVHGLEIPSDKVPRDVKGPDRLTDRGGWVMGAFCQTISLLIFFDAHVSREPLQVDVKAFGAEAVQLVGKTLHSETAVVGPPKPEEGSLRICQYSYFPVHECRLPIINHVRSQVKARDFGLRGAAGHGQAALSG